MYSITDIFIVSTHTGTCTHVCIHDPYTHIQIHYFGCLTLRIYRQTDRQTDNRCIHTHTHTAVLTAGRCSVRSDYISIVSTNTGVGFTCRAIPSMRGLHLTSRLEMTALTLLSNCQAHYCKAVSQGSILTTYVCMVTLGILMNVAGFPYVGFCHACFWHAGFQLAA